jgi:phosphate transport system substrate-binding protein
MACCSAANAGAQAPRAFEPHAVASGTLRLWGDPYMASIVRAWEVHFRKYHPGVHFENLLMGTDTAMPALYGGIADLALLGRESNTTENDGFLHSLQYKPLQLHLMSGSLDAPGKSFAPVLFVHSSNPLTQLTLTQADAVFGAGQPGSAAPAKTWGELGLEGEWKNKPLHLYALDMDSGTGTFMLRKLQGESKKMNWAIIREFADARRPDGTAYDAAEQTMDALRQDPLGLAVSSLHYADADVKPLALAATASGPFVQASRETVIDGTYPLARMTYVFVNQPPGQPVPALAKEFLRFVYSEEGQQIISAEPGFLPLSRSDASQQSLVLIGR